MCGEYRPREADTDVFPESNRLSYNPTFLDQVRSNPLRAVLFGGAVLILLIVLLTVIF